MFAGLKLHALERVLAHYNQHLPNKEKNQESFRRNEKLWVSQLELSAMHGREFA